MSKNSWILWALILLLPGAGGLGFHFAQKNAIEEQLASAVKVTSENPTTEEYLQMYDAWSNLTPDEKLENSWGQGQYGGPEIQKRLRENQIHQLWADMPDLDKGFKHYPEHLAEMLYGIGWQEQLEEYRNKREIADMTLIGSVLIISSGGLIFLGGLIKIVVVLILKKKNESAESMTAEESESDETESEETPVAEDIAEMTEVSSLTDADSHPVSDAEKMVMSKDDQEDLPATEKDDKGYFGAKKVASDQDPDGGDGQKESKELSPLTASLSATSVSDQPSKDAYFGWAVDGDGSADLDTMMTTEPLTKELTELSEEMSAIREFAAQQQDQVRKLQDGYDWMIVRRFCMRIIRCVDN
ncbi:MAG: hypothetical protein ACYSUT_12630, partial [Planctomycetota bacterium]